MPAPLGRLVSSLLATPQRQALSWTALGVVGFVAALAGVVILTSDGDDGSRLLAGVDATGSATREATPTRTPGRSPTPRPPRSSSATAEATGTAIRGSTPGVVATSAVGDGATPEPTAVPATAIATAVPTEAPVAREYCPLPPDGGSPPLVLGGWAYGVEPGGSISVLFDGNLGPVVAVGEGGGYRLYFPAGRSACANRVGASISLVYEGVTYPTGLVVPSGAGSLLRYDLTAP